ncbi:MAG: non-canonical purine NTP pyrophosphatase, RdgB/HAM1 family [Gammaproteobacteria bacterium]|nr:non-canonical purine NTP pyrophosphatase, RdgB/HAM1 family [Gammaproteobacteria bacterium]
MKVIFASGNAGKVAEMQQLLKPVGFELTSLQDFGLEGAEETATTFVENALIKCRAAAHQTGLPAIADDSGLVVPALHGEPGVYSARYASADASDADNNSKLLTQMAQCTDRSAFFLCCMTYMHSATDPTPIIAFGRWHGEILHEPQGTGGFGYDPLFFVKAHNATAAELPADTKNQMSHRGMACRALLAQLQDRS